MKTHGTGGERITVTGPLRLEADRSFVVDYVANDPGLSSGDVVAEFRLYREGTLAQQSNLMLYIPDEASPGTWVEALIAEAPGNYGATWDAGGNTAQGYSFSIAADGSLGPCDGAGAVQRRTPPAATITAGPTFDGSTIHFAVANTGTDVWHPGDAVFELTVFDDASGIVTQTEQGDMRGVSPGQSSFYAVAATSVVDGDYTASLVVSGEVGMMSAAGHFSAGPP